MPGTPTSVTSCGVRSCRARSNAPRTTSSSRSRPTSSAVPRARRRRRTGRGALRLPDRDRLGLALRLDRARLPVVDDLAGRAVGRLVREDPVHRCGVLEAGGRVDDVTGGHPFARLGAGVESDQRLTGRHGDPHLHVLLLERPVADREARAHGPLGVVLVRDGRAEERHHRVADELLDGAAVALELGANASVVRARSASTSSGSIVSARCVKPTRSQKTTVTTLRSRRGVLAIRQRVRPAPPVVGLPV